MLELRIQFAVIRVITIIVVNLHMANVVCYFALQTNLKIHLPKESCNDAMISYLHSQFLSRKHLHYLNHRQRTLDSPLPLVDQDPNFMEDPYV